MEFNTNRIVYYDLTPSDTRKAAQTLLEKVTDFDAVFAMNDLAAIHLIIGAKRSGLLVGPDLGIVGFSNDS